MEMKDKFTKEYAWQIIYKTWHETASLDAHTFLQSCKHAVEPCNA